MDYLSVDYLKRLGFKKDETCPNVVNRWEKTDKEGCCRNYEVSITFDNSGTRTLYGFINFHRIDISSTNSRFPVDYISGHRKFDGIALTIEDFNNFLNKDYDWHNICL